MHARAIAPAFIKRLVWNGKARAETRPELCPEDFRKFLLTRLRPTDSLLDFGCGPGNLLAALRSSGWRGYYIGVDVSTRAIEVAKRIRDANAEWFAGLIENFSLRNVTAVSFVESLYYVRNVPKLLIRWKDMDIYARIVHAERHADVISQLQGFWHDGPIWYRPKIAAMAVPAPPGGFSAS